MASINKYTQSGKYHLRFRFNGRSYRRSLKTGNKLQAQACLARAEETLRLLKHGRIEIIPGIDIADFLLSEGKIAKPPRKPVRLLSISKLFDKYQAELPEKAKEQSTMYTENIHINHLRRLIPKRKVIKDIAQSDLQKYVNIRLKEECNGKPIQPDTIKKELATFRVIWNWAKENKLIKRPCPIRGIIFPKRRQKISFMTWDEIIRQLSQGRLSPITESEIWRAVYLRTNEIEKFLIHTKENAVQSFIYPMMALAAYTGARRSELVRAQLEDIDFHSRMVRIREKKRSREYSLGYRYVPMTNQLQSILENWLKTHPGGNNILVTEDGSKLSVKIATYYLQNTIKNSCWSKLKGFHVFRHSFASNLASAGVDQRLIDEWMGHQTDEMRRRYRHLFPDQQRAALDAVFHQDRQTS